MGFIPLSFAAAVAETMHVASSRTLATLAWSCTEEIGSCMLCVAAMMLAEPVLAAVSHQVNELAGLHVIPGDHTVTQVIPLCCLFVICTSPLCFHCAFLAM